MNAMDAATEPRLGRGRAAYRIASAISDFVGLLGRQAGPVPSPGDYFDSLRVKKLCFFWRKPGRNGA
jgi:hypothetical protein